MKKFILLFATIAFHTLTFAATKETGIEELSVTSAVAILTSGSPESAQQHLETYLSTNKTHLSIPYPGSLYVEPKAPLIQERLLGKSVTADQLDVFSLHRYELAKASIARKIPAPMSQYTLSKVDPLLWKMSATGSLSLPPSLQPSRDALLVQQIYADHTLEVSHLLIRHIHIHFKHLYNHHKTHLQSLQRILSSEIHTPCLQQMHSLCLKTILWSIMAELHKYHLNISPELLEAAYAPVSLPQQVHLPDIFNSIPDEIMTCEIPFHVFNLIRMHKLPHNYPLIGQDNNISLMAHASTLAKEIGSLYVLQCALAPELFSASGSSRPAVEVVVFCKSQPIPHLYFSYMIADLKRNLDAHILLQQIICSMSLQTAYSLMTQEWPNIQSVLDIDGAEDLCSAIPELHTVYTTNDQSTAMWKNFPGSEALPKMPKKHEIYADPDKDWTEDQPNHLPLICHIFRFVALCWHTPETHIILKKALQNLKPLESQYAENPQLSRGVQATQKNNFSIYQNHLKSLCKLAFTLYYAQRSETAFDITTEQTADSLLKKTLLKAPPQQLNKAFMEEINAHLTHPPLRVFTTAAASVESLDIIDLPSNPMSKISEDDTESTLSSQSSVVIIPSPRESSPPMHSFAGKRKRSPCSDSDFTLLKKHCVSED